MFIRIVVKVVNVCSEELLRTNSTGLATDASIVYAIVMVTAVWIIRTNNSCNLYQKPHTATYG